MSVSVSVSVSKIPDQRRINEGLLRRIRDDGWGGTARRNTPRVKCGAIDGLQVLVCVAGYALLLHEVKRCGFG